MPAIVTWSTSNSVLAYRDEPARPRPVNDAQTRIDAV